MIHFQIASFEKQKGWKKKKENKYRTIHKSQINFQVAFLKKKKKNKKALKPKESRIEWSTSQTNFQIAFFKKKSTKKNRKREE